MCLIAYKSIYKAKPLDYCGLRKVAKQKSSIHASKSISLKPAPS